ncbi:serine/threonine protein phosphatase [Amycolatopsis sp. cmx-4-61]|uniref:serine/threonine protein phosphatase n=1 Tax=Amycolatopsis sp. cmx-4-61 TaxID=2790937 RepID=UPI003979AB5D
MDVEAGPRGQARLWHHVEPGLTAAAIWTERSTGRGEDADPLVVLHRPSGMGLLGVFDGVGGAGRAVAGRTPGDVERTQAWIASRRVRGLVEEWFVSERSVASAEGLAAHVAARLGEGVPRRGRVRGSIHRELPSTFAGLAFDVDSSGLRWEALWAGDSRCYVIETGAGLQQLSRDDCDIDDALVQLVQDPPMTNVICADRPFTINTGPGSAQLPCILLCATDGFFGYVDTPARFELVLLETLLSSQDCLHWMGQLAERVCSYTGDDASLALTAFGFTDFASLRASFRERLEHLRVAHAVPMDGVPPADRQALVVARERSWEAYRVSYERRLATAFRDRP